MSEPEPFLKQLDYIILSDAERTELLRLFQTDPLMAYLKLGTIRLAQRLALQMAAEVGGRNHRDADSRDEQIAMAVEFIRLFLPERSTLRWYASGPAADAIRAQLTPEERAKVIFMDS